MDVNHKQVIFYSIENLTAAEMGQILCALNASNDSCRKLAKLLDRKMEAAEPVNGNV